jgi:hypothetical protein
MRYDIQDLPARHIDKDALPEKEKTVSSISHGHETILLVEDDPSILEITRLMLEHLGVLGTARRNAR